MEKRKNRHATWSALQALRIVPGKKERIDLGIGDLVINRNKTFNTDGTNLLFDAAWYVEQYGARLTSRIAPLEHFIAVGQHEGLSPHPLFQADWYLQRNPDVQRSGLAGIQHYLRFGAREGRAPNVLFSANDYLKQVNLGSYRSPLHHYLDCGEKMGVNPHWLFNAQWFRGRYGLSPNINALSHYFSNSEKTDLAPHPLFDAGFYRSVNVDVWSAGQNMVEHFIEYGGSEGRSPSRLFDSAYYRAMYPDTHASNPLYHYIRFGDAEGRNPSPYFDTDWYRHRWAAHILKGETALEHYERELSHRQFQSHPDPRVAARFEALQKKPRPVHSGASHMDTSPKAILIVNHSLGGGTQTYVEDISSRLTAAGHTVWTLVYHPQDSLFSVGSQTEASAHFDLKRPGQREKALRFMAERRFHLIHYNQLLGAPDFVRNMADTLSVPYIVTIHDFYWCNPRITLVDGHNKLQDSLSLLEWERCIRLHGTYPLVSEEWAQVGGLRDWRTRNSNFLSRAERVIVPSKDTAERVKCDLGVVPSVKPHPVDSFPLRLAAPPSDGPVRIAIVGAIGFEKGSNVILECAEEAYIRNRQIEFDVIGEVREPERFVSLPNVKVTGRFPAGLAERMIRSEFCHAALFLSIWPETYSYTLTEVLRSGLFPVSLDVGAIAERLRELAWGHLLPLRSSAEDINTVLEKIVEVRKAPPTTIYQGASYPSLMKDYYEFDEMPAKKLRA